MDIQTRKLTLIQEFLKLQSEGAISRIEKFIKLERELSLDPMTTEELNKRIDESESDFENNRYKSNSELITKYQ
ncbi:MAG: hypothetical protein L3J25_02075 [Flavobacteriaceae bacterium]|nr:hypothetical protein [Flavobacteriaceae bacterium]